MNYADRLASLGAAVPEILLPKEGIDLSKWAVIACDQHTQDRRYWEQVRSIAEGSPSTLNLIYPEVYLEEPDKEQRIAAIHRAMQQYLTADIFTAPQKTLVYVERSTPFCQSKGSRKGLLIALDLEAYDWKTGIPPEVSPLLIRPLLIRPTEETVPERLPSRMDIRRGAPLETPHILVLLDDEENTLLPALGERAFAKQAKNYTGKTEAAGSKTLYDAELMLGGGRVKGWKLDGEDDWEFLAGGLEKLAQKAAKQVNTAAAPFLYAAGDGNHSLAAAKGVWEEYKASHRDDPNLMNHPARWALVELENLYDPALCFEPIHRLLFGTDTATVQQALERLPGYVCRELTTPANSASELASLVQDDTCGRFRLGIVSLGQCFLIEADPVPLAVDALQPLLDELLDKQNSNEQNGRGQNSKISMDYIHGSEELFGLASKQNAGDSGTNAVGILLPPFRKQGLFETIAKNGPLPRKSFSMGEAGEKRFYLECRKLF